MKKNVYLFQPQYAVEIREEPTYWLPYSVGCLWSYSVQFDDINQNFHLQELGYRREDPLIVVARMQNAVPAICGFSCYVWNEQYCIALATTIKEHFPDCIIVFGGAQSSTQMQEFGFVDSVIQAEGEENFTQLLRDLHAGEHIQPFYDKKRMEQLDIPSPYTTGLFDKLLDEAPNALWSMTFETNRGCPYACTFCDWGGITYSKVKRFELDRIRQDLEWAIGRPITYIICADANFGIFKQRDIDIAKIIREVADQSLIEAVNLQYAKNSTEVVFEIAKILGPYSKGVTVSVQSMHEPVLEAVKRTNMDVNNISKLMKLSKEYGVTTYTEVILGLPKETLESFKEGLCKILEMGQHDSIEMWFAQLLKNSELNTQETKRRYGIESRISNDYFAIYNKDDYVGITENIELISSTSSMSNSKIIEAYMYGWMIIQFHIGGYSQIISRYLNEQGISYRKFYDAFFEEITTNQFFGEHYKEMLTIVTNYFKNGKVMIKKGNTLGHNLHSYSYQFLYDHRYQAYDVAINLAETLTTIPEKQKKLQRYFLYDQNINYPVHFDDVTIEPKIDPTNYDLSNLDFYNLRRRGLLRTVSKMVDSRPI